MLLKVLPFVVIETRNEDEGAADKSLRFRVFPLARGHLTSPNDTMSASVIWTTLLLIPVLLESYFKEIVRYVCICSINIHRWQKIFNKMYTPFCNKSIIESRWTREFIFATYHYFINPQPKFCKRLFYFTKIEC